jgi:hypothetical protein
MPFKVPTFQSHQHALSKKKIIIIIIIIIIITFCDYNVHRSNLPNFGLK